MRRGNIWNRQMPKNTSRVVIPKEIRRTLRIREGDPLHTTLTSIDMFLRGIIDFTQRITGE